MALFSHKPLESVAEAERRARKLLPTDVFKALWAGSDGGATLRANRDAFETVGLIPHVGEDLPSKFELSTSFLERKVDLPVVIAPAAAQAMHPDGEVGVARAARRAGTAIGVANFASMPIEDITRENADTFAHVYLAGDRDTIAARVERFRQAGVKGLIFSMDLSAFRVAQQPRDWGSVVYPDGLNLMSLVKYAPMAIGNPRWISRYIRRGAIPGLNAPNMASKDGTEPTLVGALMEWLTHPEPTWKDIEWLAEVWGGPLLVKGIVRADDARRAVDAGATAVGVSNHGGNNLDTTPSPLRFLPAVVEAVGSQVDVTFDSGVRRGTDVVKALALGAKSVLIGRPWFYGLAVDGERGVYEVLETFRIGIERALIGLGKGSIHELTPDDVLAPEGFFLK